MRLLTKLREEIDQVDLARLLLRASTPLQEVRDIDGIITRPEEGTHDLLGSVVPVGVGSEVRIRVGEEDDLVMLERLKLVGLQLIHPSCCQPNVLRVELRENDSRLLCFHDTNGCHLSTVN